MVQGTKEEDQYTADRLFRLWHQSASSKGDKGREMGTRVLHATVVESGISKS